MTKQNNELQEQARQRRGYELLNEGARLLQSRRAKEALTALERAHKLLPGNVDVAINLGGALVMTGQWRRAEAFLQEAVSQHPENARLWMNLAAAHLGRLEIASPQRQMQAISAYEKAIALDPVAPSAHYNIGLIYVERQDWSAAEEWFDAALRANPLDNDARIWLKRVRSQQAQFSSDSESPEESQP